MMQAGETCSWLNPHTPIWTQLQVPKVSWPRGLGVMPIHRMPGDAPGPRSDAKQPSPTK
jgi:hypothetical protein